MADPPFAVPATIVHVVDLPMPPSVNRIWRAREGKHNPIELVAQGKQKKKKLYVSKSNEYNKWIDECSKTILEAGGMRGRRTIYGNFKALIELKRPNGNSDLDNRIKGLLDIAQRWGFVENDKRCQEITARWTNAIESECRLTLTELVA